MSDFQKYVNFLLHCPFLHSILIYSHHAHWVRKFPRGWVYLLFTALLKISALIKNIYIFSHLVGFLQIVDIL